MIYGFYFRFLRITHNKKLSIVLSKIAYWICIGIFRIKRLFSFKHYYKTTMSPKEALTLVTSVYPDPDKRPKCHNPAINYNKDLSIIVPVYNHADLTEKAIISILSQKTKYQYELILVDDGSTDGANDVVLKYAKHKNVHVVIQNNQGIAAARNTGIDLASGQYLMFVDCDDAIHTDMVEILMGYAYKEDADIVMCAHNLSKEKNGQVYSKIPNIYPQVNLLGLKNQDEIMNYAGLPWGKVYKRDLWQRVRFFPGYWYEDTIIQLLLFTQCNKFIYVPVILYEYRWYEKNFSHVQGKNTAARTIDYYWLLLAIIEKYQELGLPQDGQYYTVLLKHLSQYYYQKISGLDAHLIDAMFVLACDLLEKNRPLCEYKLPYILRITEKAMLSRDIELWKQASILQ